MLAPSSPPERAPSTQSTDDIRHDEEECRKVEDREPSTPKSMERGKTSTPVPGEVDADADVSTEEIKTKEEEDDIPETPQQQTADLVRTHADVEEAPSRGSSADADGAREKDVDAPDHPGSDDERENKEESDEPVIRRSRRSTSGVLRRYAFSSQTRTRLPVF